MKEIKLARYQDLNKETETVRTLVCSLIDNSEERNSFPGAKINGVEKSAEELFPDEYVIEIINCKGFKLKSDRLIFNTKQEANEAFLKLKKTGKFVKTA